MAEGVRHVYVGNVHDADDDTTYCPKCGAAVIGRDWYEILSYDLGARGRCLACGTAVPGRFEEFQGSFGARRIPVRIAAR